MAEIERVTITPHEPCALKADIEQGLADVSEGRVQVFDTDRIIALGKRLLADRSSSS